MKNLPTIFSFTALFLLLALFLTLTSCAGLKSRTDQDNQPESATLSEEEKAKERKHILKTADDTLPELYKHVPKAKDVLEKAYGYAVFSNTGYNIILYVGGKGKGVAFKNSDKKPIFMTMLNVGTGPGVGYDEYRQVLIFSSEMLFKQFTTVGMNTSASANVTIKMGDVEVDESGAMTLVPGESLYQINDKGIDIQAGWGGMKYFKDSDLN
jgi:lipid-binding SYLF domain-containing protein